MSDNTFNQIHFDAEHPLNTKDLKGLSHGIDFNTFDKNLQNLA
jgi:hypothetical protein